jgi:lipopolysaccharide exporter
MNSAVKDKYWLKSGLLNIIQNFSGVFFGFGSFYFLVRMLTKHDFGVWTLFMSVTTILEITRSGLIQNALIKFISSSNYDEHPKIISASFTLSGFITAICVLLCITGGSFLSSMWDSPELTLMFYIYSFQFLLTGILTQFNCIEQANMQFSGVVVTNFIRQFTFFSFVVLGFIFEWEIKLVHLLYVQILSVGISIFVSHCFMKSFLKLRMEYFGDYVKKLFNYGKYAFGTSVSSILSGTIDQMMLGALLSPAASGAYNIAIRITNLVDIPTNAVATVVFPQSAKRMETEGPEAIKYLYEKSVGTILAILVPGLILLYFLSGYVVHFIAGDKFADSIPLLRITLFYSLFVPYGRQFGTILDSIGQTKLNFTIVLFTAILNLTLNYWFISNLGVMGAAYATLISTFIGFIIAQIIIKKKLNVNVLHTLIYAYRFYPEMYVKYISKRSFN